MVSCGLCEEDVCESSATVCASCKHVLCRSCAPCIACCVKAERDALPEAVRDRVVVPVKVPQDSLAVAAATARLARCGAVWTTTMRRYVCTTRHSRSTRRRHRGALILPPCITTSATCLLARGSQILWQEDALAIRGCAEHRRAGGRTFFRGASMPWRPARGVQRCHVIQFATAECPATFAGVKIG